MYQFQQIQDASVALYRHAQVAPDTNGELIVRIFILQRLIMNKTFNLILAHVRTVQEAFTQTGQIQYCCTDLACPGQKKVSRVIGEYLIIHHNLGYYYGLI